MYCPFKPLGGEKNKAQNSLRQNAGLKQRFSDYQALFVCASPEIHRELLHRPVSGYVPEEIWKKAGEPALITQTHITASLALSLSRRGFFDDTSLRKESRPDESGLEVDARRPFKPHSSLSSRCGLLSATSHPDRLELMCQTVLRKSFILDTVGS